MQKALTCFVHLNYVFCLSLNNFFPRMFQDDCRRKRFVLGWLLWILAVRTVPTTQRKCLIS